MSFECYIVFVPTVSIHPKNEWTLSVVRTVILSSKYCIFQLQLHINKRLVSLYNVYLEMPLFFKKKKN